MGIAMTWFMVREMVGLAFGGTSLSIQCPGDMVATKSCSEMDVPVLRPPEYHYQVVREIM